MLFPCHIGGGCSGEGSKSKIRKIKSLCGGLLHALINVRASVYKASKVMSGSCRNNLVGSESLGAPHDKFQKDPVLLSPVWRVGAPCVGGMVPGVSRVYHGRIKKNNLKKDKNVTVSRIVARKKKGAKMRLFSVTDDFENWDVSSASSSSSSFSFLSLSLSPFLLLSPVLLSLSLSLFISLSLSPPLSLFSLVHDEKLPTERALEAECTR